MAKKIFLLISALIFLMPSNAISVTAPTKKIALPKAKIETTKKPKKHKSTQGRRKKLKYTASPEEELKVEKIPLSLPIPDEITTAIAAGNLDEAVRLLRIEPPSSRSLHLLRETQRIIGYNKNKKAPSLDKHTFYQNLGIAYHNLYLYLKRHNLANQNFYDMAIKFYKKAAHSKAKSDKFETYILTAALKGRNGEIEAAKKLFNKVDISIISDSYLDFEYMALYYASFGDSANAVEMLKEAYTLAPEQTRIWLAISDDFTLIEKTGEYQAFIKGLEK